MINDKVLDEPLLKLKVANFTISEETVNTLQAPWRPNYKEEKSMFILIFKSTPIASQHISLIMVSIFKNK